MIHMPTILGPTWADQVDQQTRRTTQLNLSTRHPITHQWYPDPYVRGHTRYLKGIPRSSIITLKSSLESGHTGQDPTGQDPDGPDLHHHHRRQTIRGNHDDPGNQQDRHENLIDLIIPDEKKINQGAPGDLPKNDTAGPLKRLLSSLKPNMNISRKPLGKCRLINLSTKDEDTEICRLIFPNSPHLKSDTCRGHQFFKSTIEDVPTFTYAQKLAALIECTQELPNMTPLTLCDPNEAGFYKGKEYVESLFADKDKIVENVVLQLEKLDPITEVDLDQITQLRAAFLSAKTCAELTGKLHLFQHRIKEAVMERLPDRVHINLTDRKISERRFMNELDKELAQEVVRTRELMARKKSRPAKTTSTTTGKRPLEQGVAACNITDDTFKTPVPAKKFAYNGYNSTEIVIISDCQTPLATRLQNVRKQQLCENCLGTKHTDKDCWSKRRCSNCREKHHSMLCPKPRKSSNAVPVRRIEHQVGRRYGRS